MSGLFLFVFLVYYMHMFKKALAVFFIIVFLFQFFSAVQPIYSQQFTLNQDKVEYNLPYPGILPDHPLFFLKKLRDKILEITTRDMMKKAELYFLLSDKRVAMAQALSNAGKEKQAIDSLLQAEEYFAKIHSLIEISKKQGVSASSDFTQRIKLSNEKHREVIEEFLKGLVQGQEETINTILKKNLEIKKKIQYL